MGAAADGVLAALRKSTHFEEKAHAWLYEVRNRTGYGGQERYADALVFSLWPSRGIWTAGIEVKVQRRDFISELRDPAKSASIQQFCDYWWLATTVGVVRPGEVPKHWGHIEVDGKRCRVIKDAPKLKRAPMAPEFLASIMRNYTAQLEAAYQRGCVEGYGNAEKNTGQAHIDELNTKLNKMSQQHTDEWRRAENALRELAQLRAGIHAFEKAAGLEPGTVTQVQGHGFERTGSYFAAARTLAELRPRALSEQLRAAAVELDKLPSTEEPG